MSVTAGPVLGHSGAGRVRPNRWVAMMGRRRVDSTRRLTRTRRRVRGVGLHLVLASVTLLYLFPLVYMVLRSISPVEIGARSWSDMGLTLDHFRQLNQEMNIGRLVFNTGVVTAGRVAIEVVLAVTAGFAISQIRFGGRLATYLALVATVMAPFSLMLIPLVVMIRGVGAYNSFGGLIAPTIVTGVGVLLFVQTFQRLPVELVDAARIDGCTPLGVLRHVAVPHFRSTIAAFAVLAGVQSWNEFLWANVSTVGGERRVLTVGVAQLANRHGWADPGVQMAAACVAALPIIAIAVGLARWGARRDMVGPRSAQAGDSGFDRWGRARR